jgi:membrane protease YdiL (CAAX protease family)
MAPEEPQSLPPDDDLPAVLPAPAPPHPGFWWGILWCMGFLFVTQIIPGFIVPLFMIGLDLRDTPRELIRAKLKDGAWIQGILNDSMAPLFFLAEVMVIAFSLVAIRFVVGRDWKRRLALRRPSWSQLILVLLSFPAVTVLGNGVYWLAKHFLPGLQELGFNMDMEKFVTVVRTWPWWFGVTVIGLGPGIGEELWCRGFLGRGFVGRYGVIPGILLTSFFFGIIHVDPHQGTMAMLLGIFLHYVYLTTRSLWMPMLLHFMVNSFSVTADKISEISNIRMEAVDTDPEKIPWIIYIASAFLLAAVAWALYRSRTRLGVLGEEGIEPWRPDFPSVEYPPATSIAVVSRPWPGWLASSLVLAGVCGFAGCFYLAALLS